MELIDFWDSVYSKEKAYTCDSSSGSECLDSKFRELAGKKSVLDFGCGSGWASLYIAGFGCESVTGIDASENAVRLSRESAELSGLSGKTRFIKGTEKELSVMERESFSGAFSSNTLDVIPEEVCASVIREIAAVLEKGAPFILTLNAYADEERLVKLGMVMTRERHYEKDGVLRCVNRTAGEWAEFLSGSFTYKGSETFRLPGEPEWYLRRLLSFEKP